MKYPCEIISDGAMTTLTGAPLDVKAARCANSYVANAIASQVFEITMRGPKIKITGEYTIAICGADLSPCINGEAITNNRNYVVSNGDIISFGECKNGIRAYLARGKSASKGRPYFLPTSNVLQVSSAPEFELLPKHLVAALFSQEFTVSALADRIGAQLEQLLANELSPIITSPVIPGTVQLTPDGRLIVLLAGCQSTGGYPRVLQLNFEALSIMAQLGSGAALQFCR
jgi:allophanate hydrolase subunit 2